MPSSVDTAPRMPVVTLPASSPPMPPTMASDDPEKMPAMSRLHVAIAGSAPRCTQRLKVNPVPVAEPAMGSVMATAFPA